MTFGLPVATSNYVKMGAVTTEFFFSIRRKGFLCTVFLEGNKIGNESNLWIDLMVEIVGKFLVIRVCLLFV